MLGPLPSRGSNARETYLRLRDAILSGSFAPGARLYERQVGAELGVSRTPVREALAMLEAEELVVSVPNRGTVVRRVSPAEVRETYEVRRVLEGFAARLAARRITRGEILRLRRLNRAMARALGPAYSSEGEHVGELARLNAEFHEFIAAVAGNRVLERTLASLIQAPLYARAFFWYSDPRKRASIEEHERLVEALERGDARGSERLWQAHLERGRDTLIEYLEKHAEERAEEGTSG